MERLREEVRSKKILFALYQCLNVPKKPPIDVNVIGVFWFDNNKFFINLKIFADFIGKKVNTVKHNLADHGFRSLKMKLGEKMRRFNDLKIDPICPKSWVAREHNTFNSKCTESDIYKIKFNHKSKSKSKKDSYSDLLIPNFFDFNINAYSDSFYQSDCELNSTDE